MYEKFFGLRERPFDLTPNPRYLFLTKGHREALTHLQYGIRATTGITVVLGDAGTGKTTLIHAALAARPDADQRCVYVNNPTLTRAEFVELLAVSLRLSADAARSKTRLLIELRELLTRGPAIAAALVVDEAQSLPDELLEEVRLLANMSTTTRRLLPVVLVGQPELAERLNQTSLRQLKQRIALRCLLSPLTLAETRAYVGRRLEIAGGSAAACFTPDAVTAMHEASAGIPRTVCVVGDNALITGFAAGQKPVQRDTVLDVCRDFDLVLGRAAVPAPESAPPAVAADADEGLPKAAGAEMFSQFLRPRRFLFF